LDETILEDLSHNNRPLGQAFHTRQDGEFTKQLPINQLHKG